MSTTDTQNLQLAFEKTTDLSFDEALERCREELAKVSFGILSEIDVQAKLKEKLDVDRGPYTILGACHPPSANRVLDARPEIGVFLPCNVTVSVENGRTVVRAMNPGPVMGMMDDPVVGEVGAEVGRSLEKVVDAVCG